MGARTYIQIIVKWHKLILGITFLCAFLGIIYSYFIMDKVYVSSTTLIVGKQWNKSGDGEIKYDDILLSERLVKTYSVILNSDRVIRKVINDLKLNMTIEDLRSQISVESEQDTEVLRITVKADRPEKAQQIANSLAYFFQEEVKELLLMDNVHIIDQASMPQSPVEPRPKLYLFIAAVMGVALSLAVAFVWEYLDDSIKDSDDVESSLQMAVLGTIPELCLKPMEDGISPTPVMELYEEEKEGSVTSLKQTFFTEAYRILRTNIHFFNLDKPLQIIMVTSPNPLEGKTTVAANLAIALTKLDKRILLMDCDLRRPAIHEALRLNNDRGLSYHLADCIHYKDILHVTEISNLEVITGGPKAPNPSELLASNRMKMLLEELRRDFDMIIIDAPPILPVTDTVVLSSVVDGILLVVRHGKSSQDSLRQARDILEKVSSHILGVVINRIPVKDNPGYHYYEEANQEN
jgi:succinoglycan biosynthesis transport protein ExoP